MGKKKDDDITEVLTSDKKEDTGSTRNQSGSSLPHKITLDNLNKKDSDDDSEKVDWSSDSSDSDNSELTSESEHSEYTSETEKTELTSETEREESSSEKEKTESAYESDQTESSSEADKTVPSSEPEQKYSDQKTDILAVPDVSKLAEERERHRKRVKKLRVVLSIAAVLVVIFGSIYICFNLLSSPGFSADSGMKLVHADGSFTLSWDTSMTGKNEDFIVEIYDGVRLEPYAKELEKNKDYLLFSDEVKNAESNSGRAELSLPGGSIKGKKIIVYVNTEKKMKLFGKDIVKRGKTPMIAKVSIDEATDYNIMPDVNTVDSRIVFRTGKGSAENYSLYVKSDGASLNTSTDAVSKEAYNYLNNAHVNGDTVEAEVAFGTDVLKLPEVGETYTFNIKGETVSGALVYIDMNYNPISLDRNNFLTSSIAVNSSNDGNNRITFTWNETKGEGYKISVWSDKEQQWYELKTFGINDERTYTTEKLKPCIDAKYRIEALSEPGAADSDSVQEIEIRTNPSVQYATVWPTEELPVYKDSIGDEQVGTVSLLHAMTVLDESDGRFHVKTGMGDNAEEGYIEAIKCLVNLPDYMGDLCKYDITNSYASLLTVHDYPIPEITGSTISGYGNVLLSDGTFLVPVLYPTAQSLARAGERAREQGYKLKIYDAYRPGVASAAIYDATNAAMDYIVPDSTFNKVSINDYMDGARAAVVSLSDLKNSKAKEEKKESKKSSKKKKKEEKTTEEKTTEAVDLNTYSKVMLGKGEYKLDDFLEQGSSIHSYGIALDVSLIKIESRDELSMQSHIYDISTNSTQGSNNENANLLRDIMTSEGFSAATTEWWHFQENSVRDELGAVSVSDGVSVEGWKKDDRGWRYRLADGTYYTDSTQTIGEKTFTFDKDGYTDIK